MTPSIAHYPVLVETNLLMPVAKAIVSARTKPFDAVVFYDETSTGISVYSTFLDRLDLSARQTIDPAPERPFAASLLKANACDTDIRKELPETHLSTLEDIVGLIEAQPDGKSGLLLNNGYSNIFYVEDKNGEVFAADVRCRSGNRGWWWSIDDWELGGRSCWDADDRVLCPGNVAL